MQNIAKIAAVVSMHKTLIIIPAYNEELTIGSVVTLAKKYGDVLVVDSQYVPNQSPIKKLGGLN